MLPEDIAKLLEALRALPMWMAVIVIVVFFGVACSVLLRWYLDRKREQHIEEREEKRELHMGLRLDTIADRHEKMYETTIISNTRALERVAFTNEQVAQVVRGCPGAVIVSPIQGEDSCKIQPPL